MPAWPGLLSPLVVHTFVELGVAVSLWMTGDYWYPLHELRNVSDVEYEHGAAPRRWAYNFRSFAEVRREKRPLRAEHAGFYDLFVPLLESGEVRGILVAGPFAVAPPTSAALLARWHSMTGTQGRLTDASFAEYAALTLSTLTLEGALATAFERLMVGFAKLVSGQGDPSALGAEIETLSLELRETRFADKMWNAVRGMTEERTSRSWPVHGRMGLTRLGLKEVPEHVVVGLAIGRQDHLDPLSALLRRDAFQRACVGLSRRLGFAICGKVGDHGVTFLVDHTGPASRVRAKLADVATRASAVARRHGLRFHAGISSATDSSPVAARYHAALWAAEKALSTGMPIVYSEPHATPSADELRKQRAL
ncbi:MAG TPA: hypothetical protein VGP93_10275, partial [Polyangiaceae bacterium]|nr:hypothetical protein [Polyangiaceae bacterium]